MLLFGLCILTFTCSKSEEPPAKKFNVSVSASAGGSVSTTGGQYELNEVVSITAIAADGYKFSGWSGITANANPLNVRVTSDQNITANFIKMHTLTVGVVGRGDVIQTLVNSARSDDNSSRSIANPLKASTEYEAGKTVQLTAEEANNWLFYKWNDFIDNNPEEINGENPREIVMDKSKTVTVTFEEIIPLLDPLDSGKNNTVGKWKIRKKRPGTKRSSNSSEENCLLNAVIFRTDGSFTLITDMPLISGEYYARTHYLNSKTTMKLYQGDQQIGILRNTYLTSNTIRFNIQIFNLCSESFVGYRDPTYDETNDPLAPSNTESQAADANCVTQGSVSGNTNQTVSEGSPIQNIIWSFNTNCSQSPKVVITNLPSGVGALVQNNRVIISGTPAANTVGTYNYSVSLNIAKPTTIITGQLVVVQGATVTNTNQGGTNSTTTVGGSGGGSNNTDTTNTNSSTADTTPPAITITGNATVTIIEGASYSDAGASAIDNVDGNVTGGIKTVNSVDTSTPGNYNVLYYVDDAAGNRGFATRVVIVNAATAGIYFENGTCKCFNANVGDTATINGTLYTVVDNNTIGAQIASNNVNLCTTKVTNMSALFPTHLDTTTRANFNTDISFWDTSNVTNMASMFESTSSFNSNISLWNVSNVSNMNGVFSGASAFNQNISTWDVSNATKMNSMFLNTSSFNQPIGGWNVGKVTVMNRMFSGSTSFDQDLSDWCVVKIPNEPADFSLNAPLTNAQKPVWGTCASGTASISCILGFSETISDLSITVGQSLNNSLNSHLTNLQLSPTNGIINEDCGLLQFTDNSVALNVTGLPDGVGYVYDKEATQFIALIGSPSTSSIGSHNVQITATFQSQTISQTFTITVQAATSTLTGNIYFEDGICKCPNANVGDTAVINGITYTSVDNTSIRTQINVGNYNLCTTKVTDMFVLFANNETFNFDIGFWDVSNVIGMQETFYNAKSFNQNLSRWDTSKVTDLTYTFLGTTNFNNGAPAGMTENPLNWNTSKVIGMNGTFFEAKAFNSPISNWDVKEVINMTAMFGGATSFTQDLSGWCVEKISTEPTDFATNSPLTNAQKPVWGTCPSGTTSTTLSCANVSYEYADYSFTQGEVNNGAGGLTNVIATPSNFSGPASVEMNVLSYSGFPDGFSVFADIGTGHIFYASENSNVTPGTYNVSVTFSFDSEVCSQGYTITVLAATSTDTTPPVISITGSASITLTVGDSYTDAGATATDDVSGDLTSSIVTTNPVDTSTPGTYTVTYTVTDVASNTTSIGRIVTVNTAIAAGKTWVPDDTFEQVLINLGLDDTLDNYVTTSNISSVTSLSFSSGQSISDPTGIQDFVSLTSLNITTANFTSIDLSKNLLLTSLTIISNVTYLQSIDISNLTALEHLGLLRTNLTSIDLSNNTNLKSINMFGGQLESIDISRLNINNLKTLDLGGTGSMCIKFTESQFSFVPTRFITQNDGYDWRKTTNAFFAIDCSNPPKKYFLSASVASSTDSGYTISGSDRNGNISSSLDPNLTVNIGDVMIFDINATGHPFYLKTASTTGTTNSFTPGSPDYVSNNGTESGQAVGSNMGNSSSQGTQFNWGTAVSWYTNTSGTYYYQCANHSDHGGTITVQ